MKNVSKILALALGLLGCNQHQNTKPTSGNRQARATTDQPMGIVLYGSTIASVPLYDLHEARMKPKNRYFYSEKEVVSQGISEVKLACVLACVNDPLTNTCTIDPNANLVKVVHYTLSCPIDKCGDDQPKESDVQALGEGIELHLDPNKNRMDCNGIPVEIPPHPARST